MTKATVITGFVTVDVQVLRSEEIGKGDYCASFIKRVERATDTFVYSDGLGKINREIVPLELISRVKPDNTVHQYFIGYSKEVEDLLDVPIGLIIEENKETVNRIQRSRARLREQALSVANASVWSRIKYLFTKKIKGVDCA